MFVLSRDFPRRRVDRSRTLILQIRKKKWRPINLERLDLLAQPRVYKMPMIRDPLVIAKEALTYKITRRVRNLSIREKPPEILPRIPGAVSSAALRAIGNTHITIQSLLFTPCWSTCRFLARYTALDSDNATTRLREILPPLILSHAIEPLL